VAKEHNSSSWNRAENCKEFGGKVQPHLPTSILSAKIEKMMGQTTILDNFSKAAFH